MKKNILYFVMTAIAVLANSSLTSCSLASFSGAVLGSAAYANYRPAASRSALYVSGRHTGYKAMGGGFYMPKYNTTVWGDKDSPWMMNVGGQLSLQVDNRSNIVVTEPNGRTVVIGDNGERNYRVGDFRVNITNADHWSSVYVTNPYGEYKQFLLVPYQVRL